MAESPYFQFYASDWLAGTRGLSAAEMGVYITLLAMMYEREGPVSMDHDRLARLCGATPASFRKALSALIEEGKIIETDDGLFNKRARKEIQIREKKREVNSGNAAKRWQKTEENQCAADATASISQCETDAPQNQNQSQKESANALSTRARNSAFDAFWAAYPKRVEKKGAKAKFDAAVKSGVDADHIVAAAKRYAASDSVRRGFAKNPTTWLNNGCWDDEAPAAPTPQHEPVTRMTPAVYDLRTPTAEEREARRQAALRVQEAVGVRLSLKAIPK